MAYDGDALQILDSLTISSGHIVEAFHVNKFGRNTDVGSASAEDIHDGGGLWVAPTQARTHQIASTSASDDGSPAGVGARTIEVFGLTGWSQPEVSEEVTLNGTSDVATANQYVIIHRMKVLTHGATSVNVGNITATADTDGTVTATILALQGQTQMAVYGVPDTHSCYMSSYYCSFNSATPAATNMNVSLLVNPVPDQELGGFLIKNTHGMNSDSNAHLVHRFTPYAKFDGPCIVKVQTAVSANSTDVSAGFDLVVSAK